MSDTKQNDDRLMEELNERNRSSFERIKRLLRDMKNFIETENNDSDKGDRLPRNSSAN